MTSGEVRELVGTAIDVSRALRPRWWRFGARRDWRRSHQPDQVAALLHAAGTGEIPPIEILGVSIP